MAIIRSFFKELFWAKYTGTTPGSITTPSYHVGPDLTASGANPSFDCIKGAGAHALGFTGSGIRIAVLEDLT